MEKRGFIHIICGETKGEAEAALGKGFLAASEGKSVIIVQFLGEKYRDDEGMIRNLEPAMKVFRFAKSDKSFDDLTEEEKKEERQNLEIGLNFARKVLVTEECDVLILDGSLGLLENGISTAEEIRSLLEAGDGNMEIILTGGYEGRELWDMADRVTKIAAIHT